MPLILRVFLVDANDGGECLLPLLFNPAVFFEEFFMHIMTSYSVISDSFEKDDVGAITYWLSQDIRWVCVSAVCILLLSIVFMLIAAWKVNPMNAGYIKKPKKEKKEN